MTQAANLAQVGSNANSGGTLITSGTAVASTSGTSIDFTSIPSWVKRITVMFAGVSTSGTSQLQIQIGSGSVSTSGYASAASYSSIATTQTTATSGFILEPTGSTSAAALRYGSVVFTLIGSNTWTSQGASYSTTGATAPACAGVSPALAATLDRVRITTVNGTDTFDAGSINILYE
jgi:hypothetical protein